MPSKNVLKTMSESAGERRAQKRMKKSQAEEKIEEGRHALSNAAMDANGGGEAVKQESVGEYDDYYACLMCGDSVRGAEALKCSQCDSNPFHRACVTDASWLQQCPSCIGETVTSWSGAITGPAVVVAKIDLVSEDDADRGKEAADDEGDGHTVMKEQAGAARERGEWLSTSTRTKIMGHLHLPELEIMNTERDQETQARLASLHEDRQAQQDEMDRCQEAQNAAQQALNAAIEQMSAARAERQRPDDEIFNLTHPGRKSRSSTRAANAARSRRYRRRLKRERQPATELDRTQAKQALAKVPHRFCAVM